MQIVGIHTDNAVSAMPDRSHLPYDDTLTAIQTGRTDAIIAWDEARLARRIQDLADLLGACPTVHTIRGDRPDATAHFG